MGKHSNKHNEEHSFATNIHFEQKKMMLNYSKDLWPRFSPVLSSKIDHRNINTGQRKCDGFTGGPRDAMIPPEKFIALIFCKTLSPSIYMTFIPLWCLFLSHQMEYFTLEERKNGRIGKWTLQFNTKKFNKRPSAIFFCVFLSMGVFCLLSPDSDSNYPTMTCNHSIETRIDYKTGKEHCMFLLIVPFWNKSININK